MAGASAPAAAKLNLALHVLGRRDDGYHEVETLIAFAAIADRVTVRAAPAAGLALTGPFAPALAADPPQRNLAWRAAAHFSARFGGGPWAIAVDKRLPVAAGIGGGSADAAAVLRLLADQAGIGHDDPELVAVARGLGADVPACLAGRPCLARGIGDELAPLARLPAAAALLANPGVAVPTAAVFRGWTAGPGAPPEPLDPQRIAAAADAVGLARALAGTANMLQPAAIALAPEIAAVLAALEDSDGCLLARMSGSGATCFALFTDNGQAAAAAAHIAARHPAWWLARTRLQGRAISKEATRCAGGQAG